MIQFFVDLWEFFPELSADDQFEYVKAVMPTVAALFAGVALWNSMRAYKAQSNQLLLATEKAEIDRRADEVKRVNESPHFVPVWCPRDEGLILLRRGNGPEVGKWEYNDLLSHYAFDDDRNRVLLFIANKRNDVEVTDFHASDPSLGGRGHNFYHGTILSEKDASSGRREALRGFMLDLTERAKGGIRKGILIRLRFVTSKGYEDFHDYELSTFKDPLNCGGPDEYRFRRVRPDSLSSGRFLPSETVLNRRRLKK